MLTKKFTLNPVAQTMYQKLNKFGTSFIVGGYLRDTLLNKTYSDIDFLTCIPFSELKQIFPSLSYTENGETFGVGRLSFKKTLIEIHSIHHLLQEYGIQETAFLTLDEEQHLLQRYTSELDFTINSFFFKEGEVYGEESWFQDLQDHILHYNEHPSTHLLRNPQSFIRAIRLSAETGCRLSPSLSAFYETHSSFFQEITSYRLTKEGYRILSAAYPLSALQYFLSFQILPSEHAISMQQAQSFHAELEAASPPLPLHIKLFLMSRFTSFELIMSWCKCFSFSEEFLQRFSSFYRKYHQFDFTSSASFPDTFSPSELSELLSLYKFFLADQPAEIQQIYLFIRQKSKKK